MAEIAGNPPTAVAPLAVAGLVLSLFPIVHLHVASVGQLSPISDTISDYIFVDNGAVLLALTALSLAAASVALLIGLLAAGLPPRGPAAVLLGLWSTGLTVATVFPTDPIGAPTSLSGAVHRCAGAVMFVSLPVAGRLISRTFTSPAVRRLSVAGGVTSFAFLLSHVFPGNGVDVRGLVERVLFAILYGLLFALSAHLRVVLA